MRHRRRALNVCPRLRLQAARALLPDHSDRPLFTWSFVALEVRLFKGELALWTERYEARRARRQDVLYLPCLCFHPHHKNLCQHRDHRFWIKPNSDAVRVDLFALKTVIGSTTFAR